VRQLGSPLRPVARWSERQFKLLEQTRDRQRKQVFEMVEQDSTRGQ